MFSLADEFNLLSFVLLDQAHGILTTKNTICMGHPPRFMYIKANKGTIAFVSPPHNRMCGPPF